MVLTLMSAPEEIILMGASKSQTVEQIEQAYDNGVFHFGENYLQEAETKINKIGCTLNCLHNLLEGLNKIPSFLL